MTMTISRTVRLGLLFLGLAALAFASLGAPRAQAAPGWQELGDAGDLPVTAQVPIGIGTLTSIGGAISSNVDADMYQVCLTGGGTFSAATVLPGSATFDTQLFLFDSAGFGVYANDDSGGIGPSLLPAGHPLTPGAPGVYYLAISAFDTDPLSVGGPIFSGGFSSVEGPAGPGGGSPISGWGGGGSTGTYEIALTGAEFCNPDIVKAPRLANLWLCNIDTATCDNKESGVEGVNLNVELDRPIISLDPKCVGFPNFSDPATCETQQIGSFEFEVRYDAKYVTVTVDAGELILQPENCVTATGEGFIQFACVTKGKPIDAASGPGTLAVVRVRPTADVYKLLIPNQENGIVTQLINQGCQLSDLQGHPIETDLCENAAITIRYLEGDVHADCVIDVMDQQQVAFRWGAQLGSLLYDARYDLEPSFPQADGDIDAKDLQFVYGRRSDETSTCKNPHPPQPPVDPQVKVGPPVNGI